MSKFIFDLQRFAAAGHFDGAGRDVFIYNDGDGSCVIIDYDADLDRVMILSGRVARTNIFISSTTKAIS